MSCLDSDGWMYNWLPLSRSHLTYRGVVDMHDDDEGYCRRLSFVVCRTDGGITGDHGMVVERSHRSMSTSIFHLWIVSRAR